MNYKFIGEIYKAGQRSFIKIPFNVWEECGRKGNIPVKVAIKDISYECKFVPKGNGIYYIPVLKSDLEKIGTDKEFEVSFELISGLSRIENGSPYSPENPIRNIDSIQFVNQPRNGVCGQTCVAMLVGVPVDEIIKLMGTQCSMSKMIEALNYFGIRHSDKMVYNLKKESNLPKCCIINTNGHMMVFYEGKFYDPDMGILEEFDKRKITGYLEVLV
ncbi:MAG: DUF1905 domain-containing protein [Bacillota bacterium]|nr:DUF1905 domain-containing protein [Bacillota bacterium]